MSVWSNLRRSKAAAVCLAGAFLLAGCDLRLPPPYTSEPHFHLYAYGEKVSFGLGGDSHRFKLHGWSHIEPGFTWTEGVGASLIFFVPRSTREITLEMKLKPCLNPPDVPAQPVHVSLNGRKLATWTVNEEKMYSLVIPHDFIAARPGAVPGRPNLRDSVVLVFDFFIPKAQFPALIGTGPDWRRLGVACSELVMLEGATVIHVDPRSEMPAEGEDAPYTPGTMVLFGGRQNAMRYKRTGWHGPEPGFTWTGRDPAELRLKLPPTNHALTLMLQANGNTRPPNLTVQPTLVYANGQQIAEWQVADFQEYTADIPAGVIGPDGVLVLDFVSRNAASPRELGVNTDSRPLGIACYGLMLTDADD